MSRRSDLSGMIEPKDFEWRGFEWPVRFQVWILIWKMLLLAGDRIELGHELPRGDYYAYVTREDARPMVDVYTWSICDVLPTIPIPLKGLIRILG